MNTRFAGRKLIVSLLVCLGAVLLCASMAPAQSSGTGAISGIVTDPQGRAVPNATVTATSLETNQERTATTGSGGDFKFSLLSPGNYRLKFSAAGFKTGEVSSVNVNVTETQSVNQSLEVGAITQTVTVESTVQTLQTESSTLGATVTGSQISALPMANGNYTEVLSLAAGATAGVDVVSHWRGRVGADRTTQPAWAGHRADIGGSLQPGRHLGAGLDDANAQAGRGARPVAPASGPQLGLGDRGGWW